MIQLFYKRLFRKYITIPIIIMTIIGFAFINSQAYGKTCFNDTIIGKHLGTQQMAWSTLHYRLTRNQRFREKYKEYFQVKLNRTNHYIYENNPAFSILCSFIHGTYRRPLNQTKEIANYILKYSEWYNVDPGIVTSIMAVESSFNPRALSDKNAIGLMQVRAKTETGKDVWFSKLANKDLHEGPAIIKYEKDLYDIPLAIKAGCYVYNEINTKVNYRRYTSISMYLGGMNQPEYVGKVMNVYNNKHMYKLKKYLDNETEMAYLTH